MNKKHSKHHITQYAQKRKRRNKQKFWHRNIEPRILAKKRKEEARKKRDAELKKGLKKIEIVPKKAHKPQKKGEQE